MKNVSEALPDPQTPNLSGPFYGVPNQGTQTEDDSSPPSGPPQGEGGNG